MPSLLTCNSRRRSLCRSPTVGTNGTARHVGWCTSASYLRQAVSRSLFRPRSAVRRCWSDSRTISRNSSPRRHVAAGVRPDQPARATPILQRHRGTSGRTLRGGSAPQQAMTSNHDGADELFVRVRVVNEGHRPVEARHVLFRSRNGRQAPVPDNLSRGQRQPDNYRQLPRVLGDGESVVVDLRPPCLRLLSRG